MRILLIDVTCKSGSTGKIVYDLYSHLNSNGYIATVCYGRGPKLKEKNIYKFGIDMETYLHAFLTRLTGFTGCFSYFSTKRLIKYIKKTKPDVVHIHEMHAYFLNVVMLLKFLKKKNIKVIHTLHCSFSYTGKCGYHMECNKWQTCCEKCPRLMDYISTPFFDHTKHMFIKKRKAFSNFENMIITCPSEWLAQLARLSFLKEYPIVVLPNCVDTSIFHWTMNNLVRKKHNIPSDYSIFLAVAPHLMSERKGGNWIIRLAKLMKKKNVMFILIGVDEHIEDCPNNVIPLGLLENQNELSNYYSAADNFLLCSSRETFSMTCAEALCCGTRVLGFKCGAPETVFEEPYAFFVDYGNINALMTLSERFFENKDRSLIEKYGINKFSKQRVFSQYNKILQDINDRNLVNENE